MKQWKTLSPVMAYLFFAYATLMIITSYMPVYYQSQGLTAAQIGWLLAIGPFASIFAQPIWGFLSDKYKTIKNVLLVAIIGAVLISFILFQMSSFIGFLVLVFFLFLFVPPLTALGDSLAQKTSAQHNVSFGQLRMWGSIGFGVCSLAIGYLLSIIGIGYLMYPFWFLAAILFITALFLKDVKTTNKPVTLLGALKLRKNKRLLFFLTVIMLVSIGHRTNDSFLGIYITSLGGDESLIGWAWFAGVATETVILATSALWFRRFQAITFITIAAGLYTIRWILMGQLTEPSHILWFQLFHGITFGVFYLCAFQYVTKLIPEELQATGHVLFITIFFGVSGIIGSLFGGWVIESYSHSLLYYCLGGTSFIGMAGLIVYKVLIDKKDKEIKAQTEAAM
ncbi:MFS transporter [Alkalihalobacterium bogoriense]|uniref:MFS transporter n=1 Tax=Alkalihalobacterium bogoriense TaxID=246272 RepID=UPI00047D098B|nr:MFS transporter [Alkalihalobacterium bogoriense]